MHPPSLAQWNAGLRIFVCTVGQQAVASVAVSFCMSVCSTRDLKVPTVTQKVLGARGGGSLQLECSGVSANPPLFLLPQLNTGPFRARLYRSSAAPPEHDVTSRPHLLRAAFHLSWLHERLGEIYHVQVVNLLRLICMVRLAY